MKKKFQIQQFTENQRFQLKKIYQERNIKTNCNLSDLKKIFQQVYPNYYLNDHVIENVFKEQLKNILKQQELSFQNFLNIFIQIKKKNQQDKINSSKTFGLYIFNSLLMLKNDQLQIQKNQQYVKPNFQIPLQLKHFLLPQHAKKSNAYCGLILQNQTELQDYYYYNQHIACKVDPFQLDDKFIQKQRLLMRAVWNFDFDSAVTIIYQNQLKVRFNNQIIQIMKYIFQQFKQLNDAISKQSQISKYFFNRKQFEMTSLQNQNNLNRKGSQDNQKQKFNKLSFKIHSLKSKFQFLVNQCTNLFEALKYQTINQKKQGNIQYLKVILQYLGNKKDRQNSDYDEIVLNHNISIKDRFMFAKKHLSSIFYEQFKTKIKKQALSSHDLQNILIYGKQQQTQLILQNYLDHTLDMQLVAFLSIYFKTLGFVSSKKQNRHQTTYQRFISVYKRFIQKQGNDRARIQFQKKCDQIQKLYNNRKAQSNIPTLMLKCRNCATFLAHKQIFKSISPKSKNYNRFIKDEKKRLNQCPQCLVNLSLCCVCLIPITIKNPYVEYDPQKRTKKIQVDSGINETQAITWCQTCKHGGHFNHLTDWFQKEQRCPVKNCSCICNEK